MSKDSWFSVAKVFLKHLPGLGLSNAPYFTDKFRQSNPHRHKGRIYLNSLFPPMPSAAFSRFIDIVATGRRVPISAYYAVTEHCPFKCPHCSYGCHVSGQMSAQESLDAVAHLRKLGTTIIGFTGGEPLLRKDLADLVRAVGDDTISIIFTAGYGLTRERAAELSEAGLDAITIGLESPDPREHDRVRGMDGSFDMALAAVTIARDSGLYTCIATVGTREKLLSGKLERLAELGMELGVHEFRITDVVATGSFRRCATEVLTRDERAQLAGFHRQWNVRRKGPAIASFAYLESDEMMGCGAGYHHLFVDAVGNVCPCDLTPLAFGNLREEPLDAIWERMSRWFDRPRRGCFANAVVAKLAEHGDRVQLPLERQASEALCSVCERTDELPAVYQKLKGRRTSAAGAGTLNGVAAS